MSELEYEGGCLCGAVRFRAAGPASNATLCHCTSCRRAAGAPAVAWVTFPASRFTLTRGDPVRYRSSPLVIRTFCGRCGTPIAYERGHSPHMVNVPRALFQGRTGRQPLYHIGISELQDWTYRCGPLGPLEGFPGVVWERPRRKKRALKDPMF